MRWRRICFIVFLTLLLIQPICFISFAAPSEETPLLKIAVLSDIHIMDSHKHWSKQAAIKFERALSDIETYEPDVMIINGDLTNGDPKDYVLLKRIIHHHNTGLLYPVMGNHEYYRMHHDKEWTDDKAKNLFKSQFGLREPYYDTYIRGFHFMFLASERYKGIHYQYPDSAFLSSKQLKWFEQKMKQAAALRFVFLHQPLDKTFAPYENMSHVLQSHVLKQIANAHKPLLWFSGHTHDSLRSSGQIVMDNGVLYIGGGSTFTVHKRSLLPLPGYVKRNLYFETDTLQESESRLISVYHKFLVIDVRDHEHQKWLPKYRYRYFY